MSLQNSLEKFQQQMGVLLMENINTITDNVILARHILERLNKNFYQTYEGIGIGTLDEKEYQYLPDFHKYWQDHHAEIVNARLDHAQARLAAQCLHEARLKLRTMTMGKVTVQGGGSPALLKLFVSNFLSEIVTFLCYAAY